MAIVAAIIDVARFWLFTGACVASVFLTIGIDRIDEDARGSYVFRPLLIPAVFLLWPLVLWRWYLLETKADSWFARYRPPRDAHLPAAICLAAALVVAVAVGLAIRQTWPAGIAPEHLGEVRP